MRTALVALLLAAALPAGASIFTVDSTGDEDDASICDKNCDNGSGSCTLRAAIQEANCRLGLDLIDFRLLGSGPRTIVLGSSLPDMLDHGGTAVDCATQPGYAGTPLVVIDASAVTTGFAMQCSTGHMTLKGCAIVGAGTHGLVLSGGHLSVVTGNWFGVDPTTMAARPNQLAGMMVFDSSTNQIGGLVPGEGNVFSGNGAYGLVLAGLGALSNLVQGNFIGTDPTGSAAMPNVLYGLYLDDVQTTIVGGTTRGAGNLISGNGFDGILIKGVNAALNEISGNKIGTDASGTAALPNYRGIVIDGAADTLIGDPLAGNVISGNLDAGILVQGGALRVTAVSNRIGLAESGAAALPNGSDGIRIEEDSGDCRLGGASPGEGNSIYGNAGHGIRVTSGFEVEVSGNSIAENARLGIDLGGDDAPTPNDPGDPDAGANGLQNFPLLTRVEVDCSGSRIEGTLDSLPGAAYRIEAFASPGCDASGFGEGAVFLGAASATTDAAGAAGFSIATPIRVLPGQQVTATATDAAGATSEFSACATPTQVCAGCGNGIPEAGEDCDSGGVDTPACDFDCTFVACGDGHRNAPAGETCDDSNTVSGDGCSSTCQVESCLVNTLAVIQGLRAAHDGAGGVRLEWLADAAAAAYHVNSVAAKGDLVDPRRAPGRGQGECEATPPQLACTDPGAIGAPPALLFYQALSACGPAGADEGPF